MCAFFLIRAYLLGQFLGHSDYVGGAPRLETVAIGLFKVLLTLTVVIPVNFWDLFWLLHIEKTPVGIYLFLGGVTCLLLWLLLKCVKSIKMRLTLLGLAV